MRVVGIAMVKNEADVIEAFVRHNLAYVDMLAVIDNDSVDGTREILLALQREGLPVVIFDDPIFGYFQAEKTTYVLHKVVGAMAPDYVLFLDADEFLNAPSRGALLESLSAIPRDNAGQIPWRTYVPGPASTSEPISDPPRLMRHRRRREEPAYYKAVLAPGAIDVGNVVMTQGNHEVLTTRGSRVPPVDLADVWLGHFPVRSAEQITKKAITGWMAYIKRNQAKNVPGEGYQWQALYDRVLREETLTPQEVTAQALHYAQTPGLDRSWPTDVVEDPLPSRCNGLKYSGLAQAGVLSTVVRSFARSLQPNPRLAFDPRPPTASVTAPASPAAATAFSASWHRDNLYLDLPPFRHVAEKFEPKSVLDLGCGAGGYLKLFAENGAHTVMGVDGFPPDGQFLAPGQYRQHDLSKPLDLGQKFELVVCMEVIEHLAPADEDVLIESLCRHARDGIVFSAATVNQPGLGHINCRPINHWLRKFAERGWAPLLFDSLAMRALATFSWFRHNPVVLVRDENSDQSVVDELVAHDAVPSDWPDQQPAIIRFPLWELIQS